MKKKEPGLIEVPGPNDLRPHAPNARPYTPAGREALRYTQPQQVVQDFDAPAGGWDGSQNPASAQHTPGLPKTTPGETKDKALGTPAPPLARR